MSVDAGRPRVALRVLLVSLRAMAREGMTSYLSVGKGEGGCAILCPGPYFIRLSLYMFAC